MFIWRGSGWLLLLAPLIAWFLADSLYLTIYKSTTGRYNLDGAETGGLWALAWLTTAILLGAFCWLLLPRIERWATRMRLRGILPSPEQEALRARAREVGPDGARLPLPEVPLRPMWRTYSSTFWIPLWIWAPILGVVALLVFLTSR